MINEKIRATEKLVAVANDFLVGMMTPKDFVESVKSIGEQYRQELKAHDPFPGLLIVQKYRDAVELIISPDDLPSVGVIFTLSYQLVWSDNVKMLDDYPEKYGIIPGGNPKVQKVLDDLIVEVENCQDTENCRIHPRLSVHQDNEAIRKINAAFLEQEKAFKKTIDDVNAAFDRYKYSTEKERAKKKEQDILDAFGKK